MKKGQVSAATCLPEEEAVYEVRGCGPGLAADHLVKHASQEDEGQRQRGQHNKPQPGVHGGGTAPRKGH